MQQIRQPDTTTSAPPTRAADRRGERTSPTQLQLRGASFAEGAAALAPDTQAVAQDGVSGAGGAPPHLEAVQRSFGGHDISGVRAHTGGKAAQAAGAIGAEAYATGNDVAFARGPDLHTAAHEYAHVVQQRAGVQLSGGVGRSGDRYEQHADQVADLVVSGRSAEGKLSELAGGGGRGHDVQRKPAGAVQKRPDANKTTIAALDAASIETIVTAAKSSPLWQRLVATYAEKTTQGFVDLDPASFGDMSLDLMVWIDERFQLADEARSLTDELLNRSDVQARLVSAVRTSVFDLAMTVFGMVTADVELVNEDGNKVTLRAGKVVELVRAQDSQTFEVEALVGKQKAKGTIDADVFRRQPGLTTYDHDSNTTTPEIRQEYGYADFSPDAGKEQTPDGGDGKVSDVSQGAIGDCYLMAGMGAVVAQRPDLIRKMVQYNASTGVYTVTFKEKRGAAFVDVPIQVDSYLPSKSGANPVYAQDGAKKGGDDVALWPAIIEKAYAVWQGGDYETIVGGYPSVVMEAITGAKSDSPRIPAEDQVISLFEGYAKDKKAVCVCTVNNIQERKAKLFAGADAGPYTATLPGSEGKSATVVEGSVSISDTVGKGGVARDDRQGGLSGASVASGSVTYKGGRTQLTYKDERAPASAADLEASYKYKGLVSASLNIYGNHAYMFVGVEGGKIVLANPWGSNPAWQPKPMTAAEFKTFFSSIDVNKPPEAVETT